MLAVFAKSLGRKRSAVEDVVKKDGAGRAALAVLGVLVLFACSADPGSRVVTDGEAPTQLDGSMGDTNDSTGKGVVDGGLSRPRRDGSVDDPDPSTPGLDGGLVVDDASTGHVDMDGAVAADAAVAMGDASTVAPSGDDASIAPGDGGVAIPTDAGGDRADSGGAPSGAGPSCSGPNAGALAPAGAVACDNDTLDQASETDMDCGGGCAPCRAGRLCRTGSDCVSGACASRYGDWYSFQQDSKYCLADPPALVTVTPFVVSAVVRAPDDGAIFATVGAYQGDPGAVLAFAPGATTPSYAIPLPAAGGALAITDDASALYAAVGGAGVVRIDLSTGVAAAPFEVGATRNRQLYATGLMAVPGHPERIAVMAGEVGTSNGFDGIYIYEGGARLFDADGKVWRGNRAFAMTAPDAAVFSSASRMYTHGRVFAAFDVTPSGFNLVDQRDDIAFEWGETLQFAGGKLLVHDMLVDPAELRVRGVFRGQGSFVANTAGTRVYSAGFDDQGALTVSCFDAATFVRTGAVVLDYQVADYSGNYKVGSMQLWGDDGLALLLTASGSDMLLAPGALRGVAGCDPAGSAPPPAPLPTAPDARDEWTQTYCLKVSQTALAADSGLLYATVDERDERFPNHLAAIRLDGSGFSFATWVASEPNSLALSDDESTAWLAPERVGELVRVDLQKGTIAGRYATADAKTGSALQVRSLSVLSGHPQSVVVAGAGAGAGTNGWAMTDVYDDGVPRFPQLDDTDAYRQSVLHGSHVSAVSESALLVSGGNGLARVDIQTQGFAVDFTLPGPTFAPTSSPVLQRSGNNVFDGTMLVDVGAQQLVGALPKTYSFDGPTTMAPDGMHAYRAKTVWEAPAGKSRVQVDCFDLRTFAPSGSFTLDITDPRRCASRTQQQLIGMLDDAGIYLVSSEGLVLAPQVLNCVPGCAPGSSVPVARARKPTYSDPRRNVIGYDFTPGGMERDPSSGDLYVSVRASDRYQPNVLLAFAGDTGAVRHVAQPGADPGPLALSNDGTKLYVSLQRANQIVAMDLATRAVSPWLRLGTGTDTSSYNKYLSAKDMVIVPGTDDAVAIVANTFDDNIASDDGAPFGAYLLEDSKQTPLRSPPGFAMRYDAVVAVDKDTFWLLDAWLTRATRGSDGTFTYQNIDTLGTGSPQRLTSLGSGRFVTDTGLVFDGHTGNQVATLTQTAFTHSDDGNTVLAVSTSAGGFTVACYDANTLAQTGSTTLAAPSGYIVNKPQALELLGREGVAFHDGYSLLLYPKALQNVTGCGG